MHVWFDDLLKVVVVVVVVVVVEEYIYNDRETNMFPQQRVHAQQYSNYWKRCFLRGPCQGII
jgi:hypothetical protein